MINCRYSRTITSFIENLILDTHPVSNEFTLLRFGASFGLSDTGMAEPITTVLN